MHEQLAQHLGSSEPKGHPPTTRGTREIFGKLEVGWEKMAFWSTKAAISLKRVHIDEKLLWGAYRNSPSLVRTVPSPTPYGLPFPEIGVPTTTKTPIAIISGTGKAAHFKFGQYSSEGPSKQKPIKNFGQSSRGCSHGLPTIFVHRVPCAVIFAIAQLSCTLLYGICV